MSAEQRDKRGQYFEVWQDRGNIITCFKNQSQLKHSWSPRGGERLQVQRENGGDVP